MKVLVIVWNFYPGTAYTNHTKATVRGMFECGCEVDVLSIKPVVSEESMCVDGQRITSGSFINTAMGTLIDILLLRRVIPSYDVIYCSTGDNRIVELSLKIARKHRIPVVHERTELPDIFYQNDYKGKKALSKYLRYVALFDKVFVISNPIRDYFIDNGVKEEKIHIYPMIVDPHRFDNVKKQQASYRYLAYCGNLSNTKDGVADLIEAYGKSRAKETHKLMLIGSKPLQEEQVIYDGIIQKYNLQDKIVFTGQVDRDDMPQILVDADVLLLCRPDNRQALGGFPTKLGEYLSTGNPVLVTRVGDIDKYIIDGENGYLSKPGDVEEFASKLDYIVDNYETARVVGSKGKELTYSEFNYSVQTRKVVDVLKSLL